MSDDYTPMSEVDTSNWYAPCGKNGSCPTAENEISHGSASCVDETCVCDDPNAMMIGGVCVCGNGFEWDPDQKKCVPNGDSKPPPTFDEDPCHGVICTPPRECVDGNCECPEGTIDQGGLCLPEDPCEGVLCPPNSHCEDGMCKCDEGYVNKDGRCVMSETADCEPRDDCCPANSTICIQAGSGLGGGGCFTLNQDCDKTIMLWVDPTYTGGGDAADECDEEGNANPCSCTREIQALTDMITSLSARIAELEKG